MIENTVIVAHHPEDAMSPVPPPDPARAEYSFPADLPAARGPGLPVDTVRMALVLEDFAATVTADFQVADILRQLALAATAVLQVDGAGVVVPDAGGRLLRLAFATAGPVADLERLQEELQSGPCKTAYDDHVVLNLGDVSSEGLWPPFQARAVELGLHALATTRLTARGRCWGVLDLYRSEGVAFGAEELLAARTLANLATSYLVVTEDREIARDSQRELARRAMHDTLTGLPVRWVFLEHLDLALERLRRNRGHVAVLFLDVDGLKFVNDTYGHSAGDRLLTTVVERLRETLRPEDVLARIGGDEFVVLVDGLEDPADLGEMLARILGRLAAPYVVEGAERLIPSASVGVAHTADPDLGSATLIAHADSAMYDAKRMKPGGYRVFDPLDYAEARAARAARDRFASELRDALDQGRLVLHYQPIMELDPRSSEPVTPPYAVEALLRWQHPVQGLLAASAFIDLAEASGLMPDIGAWVLPRALAQLAAWDADPSGVGPRRVFVNLSAAELVDEGLASRVTRWLAETGVSADRVTIEITEGQLLEDSVTTTRVLGALLATGVQLAIDDFGTGWSSLRRLTQVPAATIKIDQAFCRGVAEDESAAAIVSAAVALGRRLGRVVIAEGVESQGSLDALRGLGITHVQGFHLGRPVPPSELIPSPAQG